MIVLTGASSGIGAAAAVALVRKGHPVLASGRNARRLGGVFARMRRAAPQGLSLPEPVVADLAHPSGAETLARAVSAVRSPLRGLALNAGMEAHSRRLASSGVEMTMAVNHLAPVLLTYLLWNRMHADKTRIVVTASSNHADGRIDPGDLAMTSGWSPGAAYDASKLANVLFIQWLRRRTALPVFAFHPGSITTALNRESPTYRREKLHEFFTFDRPAAGAATLVRLVTDGRLGAEEPPYWAAEKPAQIGGAGGDMALADRLMARSEEVLGIRFVPVPAGA